VSRHFITKCSLEHNRRSQMFINIKWHFIELLPSNRPWRDTYFVYFKILYFIELHHQIKNILHFKILAFNFYKTKILKFRIVRAIVAKFFQIKQLIIPEQNCSNLTVLNHRFYFVPNNFLLESTIKLSRKKVYAR
jgi:hypothetical protein